MAPTVTSAKQWAKRVVHYPEEPIPVVSSKTWVEKIFHGVGRKTANYFLALFPILTWLPRYNLGWLTGDVIAGLTVGMVLVPQGMSYATIATLPVQYGLYSSFVGVLIYCFFATSKDVSIGPVAVMSLTVSHVIANVSAAHPNQWEGHEIATTLAFVCGFIVLGIGLLRLGWIVEFIPAPAVSGFMTGSAINIVSGQVPGLMGITGFDTKGSTYRVIINTLKGLPGTKMDAAFGLTGLVSLYIIRIACDFFTRRYPRRARIFFFISVLRNAFVIIVLTIAAWLYTRHRKSKSGKYPIKILQTVPSGFQHVGSPHIDPALVSALGSEIPIATIILLLEHIAISKSFGRVNNYKINPNQELIAIGVTNTVGTVFGAYPATGSFSRSALKSKSGVRTPAAGIITAIVVVVALYGLTPAFFWIPTAGLSAIIIHAVADLVAKPAQVYAFWRVAPLEFIIWLAAVLVTVFSTIENGIYTSIAASAALLLIRIAHPRGYFLGKVSLRNASDDNAPTREVFVPLKPDGVTDPRVTVTPPSPGVVVYRFEESYLYPNTSIINDVLVDHVKTKFRRGRDMTFVKASDRPWNDPGPRYGGAVEEQAENALKPEIHAIVLDFSAASHIDTTAVQSLIDTRNEVDRWADRPVEFHFATILSPWIRRALIAGGFGTGAPGANYPREIAAVVPYRGGTRETTDYDRADDQEAQLKDRSRSSSSGKSAGDENVPIYGDDTPFFHFDLTAAVAAAEAGLAARSRPPPSLEERDLKHREDEP
ncbi:hypothetical protein PLICRDRAFT_54565 [Plicaturopsis crispa FD-325 SS-3]|nr:hypothetical protein PLICRDRAFT_54565 [Plicaturopsis crispa FD-325 SS-3]